MARVFTTEFEFNHQMHKAVVAIKNDLGEMVVHIRIFDSELSGILGSEIIEYKGLTGYRQSDSMNHPLAPALMDAISKAVLDHLLK
ncbi:MAG TPA: hypothetical protein VFR58_14060 [Flavisolibacter sp.]|nr:hypothetical protein [Flavisolibacter sp.]